MPDETDKLPLTSLDIAADKRRQLRQLFPEVFTESATGELDFEKLKAVLGEHAEIADPSSEKFGLQWPGKRDALKAVQTPATGTLLPCPEESVDWDTTRNVFIEGDNLEVLKLLQKAYYGKVKMIYIDPPYNTGNDFVYPDNYAESLETYLRYTGQIQDDGGDPIKLTTNSKDSGRFHSNWLRMMYPRLYVAKNLLREDGVIFISIDDNEVSNLKQTCDQIFGEENFAAQIIWEGASKNDAQQIGISHEYILVYLKSREAQRVKWTVAKEEVEPVLKEVERLRSLHKCDFDAASRELAGWFRANKNGEVYSHRRFRFIDERGAYKEDDPTAPGGRKYELINPKTKKVIPLRKGRGWSFDQETFNIMVAEGRVSFIGESSIMIRRYLHETDRTVPQSVFYRPARSGTERLQRLMEGKHFDFPKDEEILRQLIEMGTLGSTDALVFDFFSGSGTTAHAVSLQNFKDSGLRRCLSIQLPEPVEEDGDAFQAGFKTIADIAKERLRRAGAKIREELAAKAASTDDQLDLDDKPEPPPVPDLGFRVFKLAPSNFHRWGGEAAAKSEKALIEQLEAHLDHISKDASEDDLLFEILLKAGYELTCPLERKTLAGQTLYSVQHGELLLYLGDQLSDDLVQAVAAEHPATFICLDRALGGNDALKVNTLETLKSAEPEIQFRTV